MDNFGSISDIVAAASTAIYTVGTFLLWGTTKKNTALLSVQLNELQKQTDKNASFNKVLIDNSILDAHREVWTLALNNPKLFEILTAKEEPTVENVVMAELLGTIFINHCARVHLAYHENIYNKSDIDSFAKDSRYLFSYPLIKWRWKTVAKYHQQDFRVFVDKMIEA